MLGRRSRWTWKTEALNRMVNLEKFRKLHFTGQESSEEEMEEKKEKT